MRLGATDCCIVQSDFDCFNVCKSNTLREIVSYVNGANSISAYSLFLTCSIFSSLVDQSEEVCDVIQTREIEAVSEH